MSLLEDVFLESEAGEAQELERIIEGDDFDERPRSRSDSDENSAKEDEAEEDKRRVDPTSAKPKRVIKNPRFVLNPARLTGPRGIQVVPEHFKDFKFKGKGHEKEDLDLVLKKLEHWAYRLYPKFQFQDCLKKIETLGKKRAVSVHLHRIRLDQISSEETVVQKDSSDDEGTPAQEPEDEFDKLLQQQIEIARATPAPGSVKTPFTNRSSLMPKATSSPSINDEQRERMLKNQRMAEERRLARLKQNTSQENPTENTANIDFSKESSSKSVVEHSDEDEGSNKSVTESGNKSYIVEIDDGMVTKSPRCYIPAKKHKSKIDSSDGASGSVIIEVENSNTNTVKLDNDGEVVAKSQKTYEHAKKRNQSRIDSSDDDALVINELDDDKHHNSLTKSKNIGNRNRSALDSSVDGEIVSELVTIDVEKHHSKARNNRSNVIDSSDSEDDALVMNESITVDIHHSNNSKIEENNPHVSDKSNRSDTKETYTVFDSLKASENINDGMEGIEIQSIQDKKDLRNVSNNGNKSVTDGNNTEIYDCMEVPVTEITTNVSEKQKPTENIEVSKTDLKHNISVEDEIMDVDFCDDF